MRRRAGSMIGVLFLVAATLTLSPRAGADPVPDDSGGWVRVDDDAVVRPLGDTPTDALRAGSRNSGPGFNTFAGVDHSQATYTFRLVTGTEMESYRDDLVEVAVDLTDATGGTYTVAPGTIADREPVDGEIVIRVASTSPCGSLVSGGAIGCGGPSVFGSTAVSGRVWLSTNLDLLDPVVQHAVAAHEVGHAVGLDHFDAQFEGLPQVMRSFSGTDLDSFRSGDINGLQFLFPPPPPANDAFAAAVVLAPPAGSRSGTTVSATTQAGEPDHGGEGNSVWYRFTAPADGRFVTDAVGTSGLPWHESYTGGSLGSLTLTDPITSGFTDTGYRQAYEVDGGTTYRIAVDSWGESDFTLDYRWFGCDGTGFSDVAASNPFCVDITWMAEEEISTGYPDGSYRPNSPVTRGTMAAFLYRAAGSPTIAPGSSFSDVPPTHPFAAAIAWMVAEDITGGYPDGTFRPGAAISRQGMAAFMYRMAGEPSISPFETAVFFWDVLPTHPFHDEITWMFLEDITTGFPDFSFRPGGTVTRGALSAFLFRSTVYG